jgi:hypothetical protein
VVAFFAGGCIFATTLQPPCNHLATTHCTDIQDTHQPYKNKKVSLWLTNFNRSRICNKR